MPQKFVNLENLTSFWGNAKEYIGNERKEIEDQLYNWQKTEKAPVVQCEPVPNSDLHPIVDFMFTETPPASGDKSPSNPSTITGVDSVTVTKNGKNLLYYPYNQLTRTSNGVTFTANEDGTVTINGTCAGGSYFSVCDAGLGSSDTSTKIRLVRGLPYIGSLNIVSGSFSGSLWFSGSNGADGGNPFAEAITPQNPSAPIDWAGTGVSENLRFFLVAGSGAVFNSLRVAPQLEFGSVATAFEPYSGTTVTVSLGNTFYGGSIDLFTGLMTVTHDSVVVNENTTFSSSIGLEEGANYYSLAFYPPRERMRNMGSGDVACDIFAIGGGIHPDIGFGANSSNIRIYILKTMLNLGDSASFAEVIAATKTYFAEHSLQLVYKLATPYTIQLTPQQIKSLASLEGTSKRINTIYTDADSIQVEYQKYVGIDSTLDSDSVNAIQNKVVNSALNTKVSLSGDETISGTKTFSNTINGSITGDAGTVAGHIVSKDVPVNAAFTDTTYEPATQSTAGLMSASDKAKLDAVGSVFTFKGSVIDNTYLPASDNASGDAYLAEDTGHVHVYDGTNFIDIGTWAGIPSATDAQIDALFED